MVFGPHVESVKGKALCRADESEPETHIQVSLLPYPKWFKQHHQVAAPKPRQVLPPAPLTGQEGQNDMLAFTRLVLLL